MNSVNLSTYNLLLKPWQQKEEGESGSQFKVHEVLAVSAYICSSSNAVGGLSLEVVTSGRFSIRSLPVDNSLDLMPN